jgi:hypothetical protein
MYCNDGFLAHGEVKLSGASIGGNLSSGARTWTGTANLR